MTPLLRNLLFGIGAFALLAGIVLGTLWLRTGVTASAPAAVDTGTAILVAARPIATGTLLRESDLAWSHLAKAQPPAGSFARGVNSEAELVGALTRHDMPAGEVITAVAILRPNERGFLAATLAPGYRAVTIPIDARQSASGLVLPGDRVDVILVQNLPDGAPARKSVGETVLFNARVVAVGHMLGPMAKAASSTLGDTPLSDSTAPPTITLEALPVDAQRLFVAGEIGKLELALRPIGEPRGAQPQGVSVWAGDVSNALRGDIASHVSGGVARPGRRVTAQFRDPVGLPPVLIIRGPRGDSK